MATYSEDEDDPDERELSEELDRGSKAANDLAAHVFNMGASRVALIGEAPDGSQWKIIIEIDR